MTRTEVVADAIARCQALSGRVYDSGEIFLIGDSPSDVEAGKANGIKTVAVANGTLRHGDPTGSGDRRSSSKTCRIQKRCWTRSWEERASPS